MNESDRAACYDAEEELMVFDLDADVLDRLEILWISGSRADASKLLSEKSGLALPAARGLLKRLYRD